MSTELDKLRNQVELLKWAKAREAEVKQVKETARAAIEAALGDDDTGTVDGEVVVTWKGHKRTALDQKLLRQLYPEVDAECRTTTYVRRFEIHD